MAARLRDRPFEDREHPCWNAEAERRRAAFHLRSRLLVSEGALNGSVTQISEEGESGTVEITDDQGGTDTFHGTAAAFQLLPESWQPAS